MDRRETLQRHLMAELAPQHLEVLDESHKHAVPQGAQSHFRVVVVSAAFVGQSRLQRHKLVFEASRFEGSGAHALAVVAKTPDEWAAAPSPGQSPPCAGARDKTLA